jgi:hypothetical protein
MREFSERTGVTGARPSRRYLWTDAFAVCNLLGLGEHALAIRLVEQVHAELGSYREDDDLRAGPLSGLDAVAARRHPTQGGLRIGKPLPERPADAPVDPVLEWERDGQYFHYLTRWMHALDQVAQHAGLPEANRWARELARAAVGAFVLEGDPPRMVWKMSIALDRPQIASMGQHDPLDGLITCLQLRAHTPPASGGPTLAPELRALATLLAGTNLLTDDPLGIGGLLVDAYRLAQLLHEKPGDDALLGLLLAASAGGLHAWLQQRPLARDPEERLAFRELGLAIGLSAASRLWRLLEHDHAPITGQPAVRASLDALIAQVPLARRITAHWSEAKARATSGWLAHEDINAVMLATSLAPAGYLDFAREDAQPVRSAVRSRR